MISRFFVSILFFLSFAYGGLLRAEEDARVVFADALLSQKPYLLTEADALLGEFQKKNYSEQEAREWAKLLFELKAYPFIEKNDEGEERFRGEIFDFCSYSAEMGVGYICAYYCAQNDKRNVRVTKLNEKIYDEPLLTYLIWKGKYRILEILGKCGVLEYLWDIPDKHGNSPWVMAIDMDDAQAMKILAEAYRSCHPVNKEEKLFPKGVKDGKVLKINLLEYAVEKKKKNVLTPLICDLGFDPNEKLYTNGKAKGETVLHRAAYRRWPEGVERLLDLEAKNLPRDDGARPCDVFRPRGKKSTPDEENVWVRLRMAN